MDQKHTDDHWDDTLMGRDFWADATAHGQRRTTSLRQGKLSIRGSPVPTEDPWVSLTLGGADISLFDPVLAY